ncbi:MAG: hypothetical protein QM784_10575 [Polyangiaceae bacterium]
MADVPNPYIIHLELYWPNGNRVSKNEIAKVDSFDVYNNSVTWESQCGHNDATGGWNSAVMQNISAFSYRGTPNLRFDVIDGDNHVVYSTSIFQSIAAESTVRIIVGQSAYVVGTKIWTIGGKVRFSDGSLVKAGTVKVFDVTQGSELSLGSVSLDASGTYSVSFAESAFSSNGVAHTEPNVLVRYYDEGGDLNAQSVRQDHLAAGTHSIDLKVNVRSGEFRVFGNVENPLGLPVAGVDLEVYHLAWTIAGFDEVAVVSGVSNGVGKYEFFYDRPIVPTTASPCGTPAGQMNLVVYAKRTVDKKTEILAKSDVIYDAAKEQQVDLTVNLPASTTSSEYKNPRRRASALPHRREYRPMEGAQSARLQSGVRDLRSQVHGEQ